MTHRSFSQPVASLVCTLAACAICIDAGAGEAGDDIDGAPGELWFPSEGSPVRIKPVALIQPMLLLHVDSSAEPETEGSGFALRRAEAGLKAHVGHSVYFKLVGGLEHGEAVVVDAYVHVDPLDGLLALRAGFFKPPYCRQFIVPDARRQLAESAVATALVAPHEQLGAQLVGVLGDVVEYRVGAWLAGADHFAEETGASADPVAGGRLVVHPLGPVGEDEEPDLARTPSPRFALGGSAMYDRRGDRVAPLVGIGDVGYSDNRLRVGGELAAKWRGASVAAELFHSWVWVVDDTPVEVADRLPPVRGIGGYLQAGYFALPGQLEIAARFDFVDPDLEVAGWTVHPAAGVQVYAAGHMLKLMVMYRLNLPVRDPFPPASAYHTPTTHDAFLMLQGAF